MPKKRKTRKQKIELNHKKQMVHNPAPSVVLSQKKETQQTESQSPMQGTTFSLSAIDAAKQSAPKIVKQKTSVVISTDEYGYLSIDLLKTAIVSSAIVITEIVIRILFRG